MGTAVHLRSAVCLLGRFPALAGVDLLVAEGEVVLVKGGNGAGKTTLLRALAGLVPVVGGEAMVLGHDLCRDRRKVRRRVGLLGHGAGLYDDLSVADNLHFWARACGRPTDTADAALSRLGLDHRLGELSAGRLSTGQRRRASLAALVVRAPELWLLDEPHAGLDAAGRDLVDDLVGDAVAEGATVVLASHELDRAACLASRSVALAGGRVVEDGMAGHQPAGSQAAGHQPTEPQAAEPQPTEPQPTEPQAAEHIAVRPPWPAAATMDEKRWTIGRRPLPPPKAAIPGWRPGERKLAREVFCAEGVGSAGARSAISSLANLRFAGDSPFTGPTGEAIGVA